MLNRSASLAMSTCVLKALPGKLDIKRHSSSILYLASHDQYHPSERFWPSWTSSFSIVDILFIYFSLFLLPLYLASTNKTYIARSNGWHMNFLSAKFHEIFSSGSVTQEPSHFSCDKLTNYSIGNFYSMTLFSIFKQNLKNSRKN